MFDRLERQADEGYAWDFEAWRGGDLHRLVVKSEGEGTADDGVEGADLQLLYSRATGVYTDLQLGLRADLAPGSSRTYAVVGFETLLPYWIEAEGGIYLSNQGEVAARLEAASDLRLTQRLILQPRAETGFATQDVAEEGVGRGLKEVELGLRLRYEVAPTFAPYVGVAYQRKFGRTADLARDEGARVEQIQVLAGLRAWF
jgi:copper resistance protein B